MSLEATMTKLGWGVDELEVDLLQGPFLGVNKEWLKIEQAVNSEAEKGIFDM